MADKDNDQLDEVKATGENSSTMDPVTPAGGSPKGKNRKADKNASAYPVSDVEDEANEKKPGGEPFDKTSPAERKGTGKKAPPRRADKTAMKESVEEMFEGQDLSEDFKTKAAVVFEAAVNNQLAEHAEQLEEEFAERLEEQTTLAVNELIEQVDTYLDYVVEQWMEDNELAIDRGIKAEMAESFMNGLFNLYQEHNINVPEESEDVLDEMAEALEKMEDRLDEVLEENIQLKSALTEAAKADIYDQVCEGLTETQAEKLIRLSEGISYEDEDDFAEKVEIIKESYFGASSESKTLTEELGDDNDPIDDVTEHTVTGDPEVNRYAAAISKTLRK